MKISKKTLVVASLAILIPVTGYSAFQTSKTNDKIEPPKSFDKKEVIKVEEPDITNSIDNTEEVAPKEHAPAQIPEAIQTPPQELDIYEYIQTNHPHLVQNDMHKECLEAVVARFPERFTPENRKDSLQRMSIFSNACTTWVTRSMAKSLLDAPGGVFTN